MEYILEYTQNFNSDTYIFLVGYFNVHFNNKNDTNTQKVTQLFMTFGLQQIIKEKTHNKGNCLDNIFSNQDSTTTLTGTTGFSDHPDGLISNVRVENYNNTESKLVE